MFSEVAEIALVAVRLGKFLQLLKTRVILILNFTRPHAITYTNVRAYLISRNRQIRISRGFIFAISEKKMAQRL